MSVFKPSNSIRLVAFSLGVVAATGVFVDLQRTLWRGTSKVRVCDHVTARDVPLRPR